MQINCQSYNNHIASKGLFQKIGTVEKTTGKANINKVQKTVYKYIYYPFENETKKCVEEIINKYTVGRIFALWEKDHGHQEGVYYQVNHIKVAAPIKESSKKSLIAKGYSEKPISGVLEYNQFMDTYNNEAYATLDVMELKKTFIDNFIKRENLD